MTDLKTYCIYKITNPEKHIYIGQSKYFLARKMSYKRCDKSQYLIYKSIKHYGIENHSFEILIEHLNSEQANKEEIRLIKHYKELKISLNVADGGQTSGKLRSKSILQFDVNGNFIKEYNSVADAGRELQVVAKPICLAAAKKNLYSNGFLWVYKKDYENGVLPKWIHKNKTTIPKKINQFDLDGNFIASYDSREEAVKITNINPACIYANVIGKTNKSKNFIFSEEDKTDKYFSKRKSSKKVQQFDLNKKLLNNFETATEAANKLNISRSSIYNSIRENRKCHNFIFKYLK